jgi:NADPH:quinone reductase-like Zn-dependent oxidoreductase
MKAATLFAPGQNPVWADFSTPQAGPDEWLVQIHAAALSPLTRARASGTHYSAQGTYPFVAGVDGTGTLPDGRLVYAVLPRAPFGAMAEQTVVAQTHCLILPDGLDPVAAAAIANPGMSSWAALAERAHLGPGETVLINGATGASGQLAVQIARHMGAARVIATGRNREALAALNADGFLVLGDDDLEERARAVFAQGVDVVLDYLWGPSAETLLTAAARAAPEAVPIRFVQIGTAGGADIRLPGAVLRSSSLQLMGSGIGSVPLARLLASIAGVFDAAAGGHVALPFEIMPMDRVEEAWAMGADRRIVLTVR